VAEAFGYSAEELTSIPAEANMGLSCGNPTATAHLRSGEIVVDLGSGGGLDVFLAAKQVGPNGRAIGIDMTPAMIERARTNAAAAGYTNVEFHLANIDKLPLPDASVDCVISNCVLNLAPDKPAVFREIARVLKPGGRLAVSDIALKGELPEAIASSLAAYVGCIAGAIRMETYREELLKAGFAHVEIVDSGADLNGEPIRLLLSGDEPRWRLLRHGALRFVWPAGYLRCECGGSEREGLCGETFVRRTPGSLLRTCLLHGGEVRTHV
jgi:SAM-dependent methyltransferase